jgi:hypothetical protein
MIKLFEVISVNTIYFRFGQTWASLTGTDPIVAFFRGRREYSGTDTETGACSLKTASLQLTHLMDWRSLETEKEYTQETIDAKTPSSLVDILEDSNESLHHVSVSQRS